MSCFCGQRHAPFSSHGRPAPAPGQIALSGRLFCTDTDQLSVLREFLPGHIAASRAEPGCLFFDITPSEDPLVWHVEELFTDEVALKAHKARTMASIWAERTAALPREVHRIDG